MRASSNSTIFSTILAWYFSASSFISSGISTTSHLAPSSSPCQIRAFILMRSMRPAKFGLGADGQLDRHGVGAQHLDDRLVRHVEIGAHAVHLVDVGDARHVVLVGLAPDGLGLGLDALHAVEADDRAVEHAQRALDLGREVHVAGRVDDVDRGLVVALLPLAVTSRPR